MKKLERGKKNAKEQVNNPETNQISSNNPFAEEMNQPR
jgi:hypothetical protein